MGLIVAGRLKSEYYLREEGKYVGIFIPIPKKYLAEAFHLESFKCYAVEGILLDIKFLEGIDEKEYEKILSELKGRKLTFYLRVTYGRTDFLLFSEDSWKEIRDYGIFPEDVVLKVKLTAVEIDGKKEEIYPERDVSLDESGIELERSGY